MRKEEAARRSPRAPRPAHASSASAVIRARIACIRASSPAPRIAEALDYWIGEFSREIRKGGQA